MEQKITKEQEHKHIQERFKKTPEEREQLKLAKSLWKKTNSKKK